MRRLGVCRALTAVSLLLPALGLALAAPAVTGAAPATATRAASSGALAAPTLGTAEVLQLLGREPLVGARRAGERAARPLRDG